MKSTIFKHFPLIGTIRKAKESWTGGEILDYTFCAVSERKCDQLGAELAKKECVNCINQLRDKFIMRLPGPSVTKIVLEALGTVILIIAGLKIIITPGVTELFRLAGVFLILMVIVFIVDITADFWLYFRKKRIIRETANSAKLRLCDCKKFIDET